MNEWILICNSSIFDIQKAFKRERTVTWTLCKEVSVGDIVYFYVTNPYREILYKCKVTNVNLWKMDDISKECVKHIMFYERQQNYMRLELLESYPEGLITDEDIKQHGIDNLQTTSRVPSDLTLFIKRKTESTGKKKKTKNTREIFIIASAAVIVMLIVLFSSVYNDNDVSKVPSKKEISTEYVSEKDTESMSIHSTYTEELGTIDKQDASDIIYTGDEISQKVREYCKRNGLYECTYILYEGDDEKGRAIIHCYEIVIDDPETGIGHTVTADFYYIEKDTLQGVDILGCFVDLND